MNTSDRIAFLANKFAQLSQTINSLQSELNAVKTELVDLTKEDRFYDTKENIGVSLPLDNGKTFNMVNQRVITVVNKNLLPPQLAQNSKTKESITLTTKGKKLLDAAVEQNVVPQYAPGEFDYMEAGKDSSYSQMSGNNPLVNYLDSIGINISVRVSSMIK